MSSAIFVISSNSPGGAEKVMIELANKAIQLLDTVELVFLSNNINFYTIDSRIVVHNPNIQFSSSIRLINILRLFIWLRKSFKNSSSKSVLSFGGKYNAFVLLASFGLNKKVFISDRSRPGISYGHSLDLLNRIIYPKSAGIIAQTKEASEYSYKHVKHNNIRIISNPFRIPHKPSEKRFSKELIILNVGRFIKSKHQDWLVEYFDEIDSPLWNLYFLGDGDLVPSVKEMALRKGSSKRIHFPGNTKDLGSWYNRASIFAFTSTSEGFPNALGEAMSFGCSCISFDCVAGPSEIIDDGVNGFLIPEGDHELYVMRLRQLVHDEELRIRFGKNAHEKMKQFNIDKIAKQYLDFMLTS